MSEHDSSSGAGHGGESSHASVPAQIAQPNCIFCQIAQGKISSQRVFEDEEFLVVLDINPANPGHCIVLPKTHYQVMPQMPDESAGKMMVLARKVSHAILRSLKAHGTAVFVANGAIAGQRAPHFMLHVIPRMEGDGVALDVPRSEYSLQDASEAKRKLSERIAKLFGGPKQGFVPSSPKESALPKEVPKEPKSVVVDLTKKELSDPKPLPVSSSQSFPVKLKQEPQDKSGFIWDRKKGLHLQIKGLASYDVSSVTLFLHLHPELVSVVRSLLSGPKHVIEIQREVDFTARHLLALEYLGYVLPLSDSQQLKFQIAPERTKNHPGRIFYAITAIGRKFLDDVSKPLVLPNAVKEKIILEELGEMVVPSGLAEKPLPILPEKKKEPSPSTGQFDLDALADLMGGQ